MEANLRSVPAGPAEEADMGVLVLARRVSQTIVIRDSLFITLADVLPGAVDLAIYDSSVRVHSAVRVEKRQAQDVGLSTRITFCGMNNTHALIGVDCPKSFPIHRKEVWDILRRDHGKE